MSKPSESQMHTAIVGSGFIGRAWAISFARAGANVRLWDQADGAAHKAIDYISGVLEDLAQNDLLNGQTPATVLARISAANTLDEALAAALMICEYSQVATMAAKESVNRAFEGSLADGISFERRLFHALFATDDQKEGMSAFVEKRKPSFVHK